MIRGHAVYEGTYLLRHIYRKTTYCKKTNLYCKKI